MGFFCASTSNKPNTSPCGEGDSAVTKPVWDRSRAGRVTSVTMEYTAH